MNKFEEFWLNYHLIPDIRNRKIIAREAWNAAIDAAANCIVIDGNPKNALERIKKLIVNL